jgi:hypothetical protein
MTTDRHDQALALRQADGHRDDALLQLLEQLDGEGWEIVEVVYQRGLDRLALLRAPRDDYLVIIRRPAAE